MPGKGIDCPYCGKNLSGPTRLAEHIFKWHMESTMGSGYSGMCSCCNQYYQRASFVYHFRKETDKVLAAMHAKILGVNPHEKEKETAENGSNDYVPPL